MLIFKKLKSFYLPYKKDFIWSMLFLVLIAGITVVYPMILQLTIDEVVLGEKYELVPWISLGFIAVMAVKGLSAFIQHYLADMFGIKSVFHLRNTLYEKLQRLPFSYYDNAKTGDLMSRLTADVEGFRFFVSFGFSEVLRFVIVVTASLIVMFNYSVTLTFVTIAALPFISIAVYKFDKDVHPAFRGIRGSLSNHGKGKVGEKMEEKRKKKLILERFHYSNEQVIDKAFNWQQISRLLQYVKPYAKSYLPLSFLAVILSTAIRLIIPILIGVYTLDRAIIEKDTGLLLNLVFIISGLYLLSYLVNALRIRWMNKLGQNVIYDLRKHLFTHVQSLSHRFFDQRSAGSILVRIMNDINSLQELFTNGVINLLTDFLLLLAVIFILFSLNAKLTIAIMVILPIMFFISTSLRKKIRLSWQMVRLKQSKINSHLNESIQGIRVTQVFTQEDENIQFFKGLNKENFDTWQGAVKKNAMFGPFVEMTNAIGTAILIWYGAFLVMNGESTIGEFVSFAFYLGMFWEPISRLGQLYNQLLIGMASFERIFEYLDERPLVAEAPNARVLASMKGKIEFEDVTFSYDEKRTALNGISFSIQAGETAALVGHTGSGKTTIANLISRFYDATEGEVKIDGHSIQDISVASLRSQISVVLQDTFIFSGTIMENIRFGNPSSSDEEVVAAATAVGADSFITKLSNGYHTEVEERGNVLSVGERQLLSFARTLLADPKILILDEATASIDTETEVKIQRALKTILKGRTAIIIAHRLSTIREADKIIVMEHGNILEQGNHEMLMAKQGVYYELVKAQYKMLAVG